MCWTFCATDRAVTIDDIKQDPGRTAMPRECYLVHACVAW